MSRHVLRLRFPRADVVDIDSEDGALTFWGQSPRGPFQRVSDKLS